MPLKTMFFFASLYNFAVKNKIKYILTGGNHSTECIREPLDWIYHASDLRQIKDIHKKHGSIPMKTFPTADIFKHKIFYKHKMHYKHKVHYKHKMYATCIINTKCITGTIIKNTLFTQNTRNLRNTP